ncbi:MAG: DUF1517 domain-containing protein [Leptolyngbya sp. SIO4C1]|nr:DUF1517 domain-containing protein [Leptolyngbya sp. SIO4C1]
MVSNFKTWIKPFLKPLLVFALAVVLIFSQADGALAARAGGRIGGGSFRAPSRPYSPPSRSYRGPAGGGYYPGGGFGFPFIFPFFGFGGGGLFSLLIFFAIASFLVRSFRSATESEEYGYSENPTVSVAKLQIGLLAKARYLQDDLNRMAETADTSSSEGLAQVLQETTLSLLRHPEYWAYADANIDTTRLLSAEQTFNRLALTERSKLTGETLSNVNNRLQQAKAPASESSLATAEALGEYIVATVLVATQGQLSLPKVQTEQDVRKTLSQLGAVSSDRLLAIEILWTPQAAGETLTSDELVAEYPNLKLV